jgi:filamentous hemagglutinin family protein
MKRIRNLAISTLTGICACLGISGSSFIHADVVFDGSTGPFGSLIGDMVVGEDWGTRQGSNLFHSFQVFNINTGESLTFTSNFAGATNNVIARVTGGRQSLINGPLTMAIPGAALWLINPSGLVFGEAAVVDVKGSFYASTADYLLLDDGGKFSADLDDASGTILTMGNPVSFGFLNPAPAAIDLQNTSVTVGEGESLVLAGGDISLDDSRLSAPSGHISLLSVASQGELGVSSPVPDAGDFDAFGDISLDNSDADTSGNSGGDIYIVGGQLVLDRGSVLDSTSTESSGGVIDVRADGILLDHDSGIDVSNTGSGNGSSVLLQATDSIVFENGGYIEGSANADGNAGDVTLRSSQNIAVSGNGTERVSGIFTTSTATGKGGDLLIEAPVVSFLDGTGIFAGTRGRGNAGTITINAADSLVLQGLSNRREAGGIFNLTENRGDAGDINLNVGSLDVIEGSSIIAGTTSIGDAGDISITATGNVNLIGTGFNNPGGVLTTSLFGAAGDITITAADLTIAKRFGVDTGARRAGGSGDITIDVNNLYMSSGAKIETENSVDGESGSITITAIDTISMQGTPGADGEDITLISSNALDGVGAGDITLSARAIELENASIFAIVDISDAASGDITLNASEHILLTTGTIEAATRDVSAFGPDIVFNTPLLELTDDSFVATNVFQLRTREILDGGAGSIIINVGDLLVQDSSIEAQACNCGSGSAGDISINATGNVIVSGQLFDGSLESGILTGTFGGTGGGNISITANELSVSDGAIIGADSGGTLEEIIENGFVGMVPGDAGAINISANVLNMSSGGQIRTSAVEAAGGIISLNIADLILMTDSSIKAETFGVTPGDDGGNIFITRPTAMVMNHSSIIANANAGNGGNIGIATEVLVPSIDSRIEASSQTGLDGEVIIESPNQQLTDVALLETPRFDITELIGDPCEVRMLEGRSSLTVEGKGGVPAAPDEFQVSPFPANSPDKDQASLQHGLNSGFRTARSNPAASAGECINSAP